MRSRRRSTSSRSRCTSARASASRCCRSTPTASSSWSSGPTSRCTSRRHDRNTTRTYDPSHDSNTVERLALMEELRAGMDSQLVLHYQPKCRAGDGVLTGVEVLVRWQHPERGLHLPGRVPGRGRELRPGRPDDDADPTRGPAPGRRLAGRGPGRQPGGQHVAAAPRRRAPAQPARRDARPRPACPGRRSRSR